MNISDNMVKCIGCAVCEQICPVDAIQMRPNEKGFLYPVVDNNKCVNCEKCRKHCPTIYAPAVSESTKIYGGFSKSIQCLMNTSSGGVFPILAGKILQKGGIIYGAGFDRNFEVKHTEAEGIEELNALLGSKYVQSAVGDCYKNIENNLKSGRLVYFSGTPCQAAALIKYLGKEYENLVIQDVVCHSVPSPKVWRYYLSSLMDERDAKPVQVSFRKKINGWEQYSFNVVFDDGSEFSQLVSENSYLQGFIKGLYSRDSCYSCLFKGVNRCSDITLADYWGVKNLKPEIYNPNGTSIIMVHSEKGQRLFESCVDELVCRKTSADNAFTFNQAALKSQSKPKRYEQFWANFEKEAFDQLIYDCLQPTADEIKKEKRNKSFLNRAFNAVLRRIGKD